MGFLSCASENRAPHCVPREVLLALVAALAAILGASTPFAHAQGLAGNLLANPGFERPYVAIPGHENMRIAEGWTAWWVQGSAEEVAQGYRLAPEYKAAFTYDFPYNRVRSGELAQQYFHSWGNFQGGIYQRVKVPVGARLQFTLWGMAWSCDRENKGNCPRATSGDPSPMHMRIGIDPTGGTDPFSPAIVWSPEHNPYDAWSQFSVEAVSQNSTVTVFTYAYPDYRSQDNNVYLDDASLVIVSPPPTPTSLPTRPKPTTVPTPKPTVKLPAYSGQIYIVGPADTLQSIAARFGTTVEALMTLNSLTSPTQMRAGMRLRIPK
jgi:LysM repeat protein